MPDNHLRLKTSEKRQILVVDDEIVNRQLLGLLLSDDYSVIYAENGEEALEQIANNSQTLSLVLLDLLMPVMSGMVVLRKLKEKPELAKIPVIVMTADHESEVASLELGAMDFIPKPYPEQNVILARIRRIIELSEDRQIIRSTERDALTGLYNREFFYNYAETFDQHHRAELMDAIVMDINHFHLVNERYGRVYADQILRKIGLNLRELVQETGGIVCRREADTFMIYRPHCNDYEDILEAATAGLSEIGDTANRIHMRLGVYRKADKALGIEQRFDRAKAAADTVRNNYSQNIAVYDERLHEREIFAEQLTEGFDRAIREKQFRVYFQPKYDIRSHRPVLTSAEALVRWQHPDLGLIHPGMFIPLFEENGMIQRLDHYVWNETASAIRGWKNRLGLSVPVSVNVSRVDLSDYGIAGRFQKILDDHDLEPEDIILEITESAYSEDEEFIIPAVNTLRGMGLRVEMDDFGTGYSSLGMISKLPIDALKMDMVFVRNAFAGRGDMKMIELIIDIAGYLRVPVIAEGVDTKEQAEVLKEMGCDIIQGYYFSKPVPSEQFEAFIADKRQMLVEEAEMTDRIDAETLARAEEIMRDSMTYARIAQALAQDYYTVYYINTATGEYIEYCMGGENHRLFPVNAGKKFFEYSRKRIAERVIPSDCDRVMAAFDGKNLLRSIRSNRKFSITYQLHNNGSPMNVSAKAINIQDDPDHILIGFTNIDEQVERDRVYQEALKKSVTYGAISKALAADYFSIYYVDTDTGRFIEYSSHQEYETLKIEKDGDDFFETSRANIRRVIYRDDQNEFLKIFTKENLMHELDLNGSFTTSYRLVFDGKPTWVSLKATRMMDPEDSHIVIGVNNIDNQMKRQEEYESAQHTSLMYSRIVQALAKDYYSIYMVNMLTEEFIEYSAAPEYQELKVEKSGRNFFEKSRENVVRLVHPDDLKRALSVWEKDRLQKELAKGIPVSSTYRLLFDKRAVYINCKVIRMTGEDEGFILVAISNVDEQVRREQEYANDLRKARYAAMRDPMTGVKSKHAFNETEKEINSRIEDGSQKPFAIAICDVNGLKTINDTFGHKAGDQYIVDACRIICNRFKHSPVFRIGGDEFVAILQEEDYLERDRLVTEFREENGSNSAENKVVIACGISDWRAERGDLFEAVFKRADERMYANKNKLKDKLQIIQ